MNKDMLEVSADQIDMMMNPKKYMEEELRQIEEEEKAKNEEYDRKNGKPLDIQTYELIQRGRTERLESRLAECRKKWNSMKGYT